jgi:hypothetical protein
MNSKAIAGLISLGDGSDAVTNKGTTGGTVDLGAGNDVFNGGIDGADRIDGGAGIGTYDASDAVDNIVINIDIVDPAHAIVLTSADFFL